MPRPSRRTALAIAVLLLAALAAAGPAAARPGVVASIKPVHALVAGVMEGVAQPTLLVRGGGSPHAYSLRPSDARALSEAELVFWVGEALETFLARPLASIAAGARRVALGEAPGLTLLRAREGGAWEADAHEEAHLHPGPADEVNPHVWLSPANARAMVDAIVAALAAADPARAAAYRDNGTRLAARLAALEERLRARLAPVAGRPYLVFHDAYPYFEAAFGLNAVGAITVSPGQAPGVRRLLALRERVRSLGAVCVFAEPQFEPRLVRTVVEGTSARTGVLDPLGADIPAGPAHYFTLMERLADALVDCLAPR